MSDPILVSISPVTHAATITLNRPTKGNSLTPQLQADLVAALAALALDDEVHSVILTGAGKFFCTGMDLGSGGESTKGRAEEAWDAGQCPPLSLVGPRFEADASALSREGVL